MASCATRSARLNQRRATRKLNELCLGSMRLPVESNGDITIVGPGAIGGTMAAWLAQDPRHRITVVARTAFDRLEVQTPDGGVIKSQPLVLTDPAQATPAEWVLIATKAYDVVGTSRWLEKLCQPGTLVAVLQNGVEHLERFTPYVPTEQIVPVAELMRGMFASVSP
jgi:ketopantoate reductase